MNVIVLELITFLKTAVQPAFIFCFFVVSGSSGDPGEGVRGGAEKVGEENFRTGKNETTGTTNKKTRH